MLVQVTGDLDATYVRQTLARAGVEGPSIGVDALVTEPLTDGRSGAVVTALRLGPDGPRLVHKAIRDGVGFRSALKMRGFGEGFLWAAGLAEALPPELTWPIIEAVRNEERQETWLLMHDVSEGILPRGAFAADLFDRLLCALARMHAAHWGRLERLDHLPLFDVARVADLFCAPVVVRGRERAPPNAWTRWMIDSFVLGRYLPRFLEVIGPRAADDYLAMAEHRAPWLRALMRHEPTLVHNDIRRANVSYLPDGRVALIDWERATGGPAAIDLTWSWFLQFWAYPPTTPHDPDAHRARYLAALEGALGRPIDRAAFDASWGLGWVLVMCEIGFLLVDGLVENPDLPADEVARVVARARRAVDLAREAADRA